MILVATLIVLVIAIALVVLWLFQWEDLIRRGGNGRDVDSTGTPRHTYCAAGRETSCRRSPKTG